MTEWASDKIDALETELAKAHEELDAWRTFALLRTRLFAVIQRELALDGYCKSYEGALGVSWPHAFEDPGAVSGPTSIHLYCYVVGPTRRYDFTGATFAECLTKLEASIHAYPVDTPRGKLSQ